MSTRQVTIEERAQLDDLHRLVLDELCRRHPDKWVIVDPGSSSMNRRRSAGNQNWVEIPHADNLERI